MFYWLKANHTYYLTVSQLSWVLCFRVCHKAAVEELARDGVLSERLT